MNKIIFAALLATTPAMAQFAPMPPLMPAPPIALPPLPAPPPPMPAPAPQIVRPQPAAPPPIGFITGPNGKTITCMTVGIQTFCN